MKPVLLGLGGLGFLTWGASLFVRQAVRWAVAHPVVVVVAVAGAVPALFVLVRGMPSTRELRRAIREGMAEVDTAVGPEDVHEETDTADLPASADPVINAAILQRMDADDFEQTIAGLCERDGCVDVRVVGGAGDLGADVLAYTPDGYRVVIQCKRYAEGNKVGSQDVQRFGGTCYTVHEADIAALVTTSAFTEPATAYADMVGIRCCDGSLLTAWYEGTGPAPWLWDEDDETGADLPLLTAPASEG